MKPTGRIQENQIITMLFCVFNSGFGNINGRNLSHLENGNIQLFSHDFQLLNGSGAVHITSDEKRPFTLLLHQTGQFCRVGGFAGALKTNHHHNGGRFRREVKFSFFAAH